MNINEVKKALKCCINEDCDNCPIYTPDETCIHLLLRASLNTINYLSNEGEEE